MEQLAVSNEVHLRRMKVRPALVKLERYLNDAAKAGLPWVRIVHGKSGGAMKQAVIQYIAGHALVASHHSASPAEGNGGVTVAKLK